MKRITSILAFVCMLLFATDSIGQEKESPDFNKVNLKDLRKSVTSRLYQDGLINSKKDEIRLELRTETTFLNGKELSKKHHDGYSNIAEKFEIGRGSYRTIYITSKCTAVGDFYEDSFTGKVEGKMSLVGVKSNSE